MDYRFSLNLGLGGLGIIGRMLIAFAILFIMRNFDKNNKSEYDRGIKWLLIGGVVCAVVLFLLLGIFRGIVLLPSRMIFDGLYW